MKFKKQLGQNFLRNRQALKKIIEALEIESNDVIIEIGAGSGNLTSELLKKTKKIIAIEKDKEWLEFLKKRLGIKNDEWPKAIEGDVRDVIKKISLEYPNYKIVGNIPYYLSGQLLRIFQELKNPPQLIVLTLQKEVVEKILAQPPKANLLSNILRLWAEPKLIMSLKSKDFYPVPKVNSAVIKLKVFSKNKRLSHEEAIIKLLKIAFKQPRKTLLNNLSTKFEKEKIKNILKDLNLTEKIRSNELSLALWINIVKKLNL